MIDELKKVITQVEQLEINEQQEIAKMLTEEIMWHSTLENSQEKLQRLGEEALNEHALGNTKKSGW